MCLRDKWNVYHESLWILLPNLFTLGSLSVESTRKVYKICDRVLGRRCLGDEQAVAARPEM